MFAQINKNLVLSQIRFKFIELKLCNLKDKREHLKYHIWNKASKNNNNNLKVAKEVKI